MLDVDVANEYARAYYERQQMSGVTAATLDLFAAGDDATRIETATVAESWLEFQTWIEANYMDFVNIDGKLDSGDWDAEATIDVYASLAEFRSVAGLNSSGFRRATTWSGVGAPTFSYGLAQGGDIFGYWVYEDLAAAFSAMIHTKAVATIGTDWSYERNVKSLASAGSPHATCALAIAALNAKAWPGSWVSSGTGQLPYAVHSGVYLENPNDWTGGAFRQHIKPKVPIATTALDCVCDVYVFLEDPGQTADYPNEADTAWDDADSTGATEDAWHFFEELAAAATDPRESDNWFTADTGDPTTTISTACGKLAGIRSSDHAFVCRWDITNSDN